MDDAWEAGPPQPPPARGEVHLWWGERERGEARGALADVLARYLGLAPAAIELKRGEYGKPALALAGPPLEFNLSHSAGRVLIAVCADRPVGVDIEATARERDFLALAARALPAASAARVRAAPPGRRAAVFYAAWTAYEAEIKCLGGGIAGGPGEAPLTSSPVGVGAGFAAAIAVPGDAIPPLRRYLLP